MLGEELLIGNFMCEFLHVTVNTFSLEIPCSTNGLLHWRK